MYEAAPETVDKLARELARKWMQLAPRDGITLRGLCEAMGMDKARVYRALREIWWEGAEGAVHAPRPRRARRTSEALPFEPIPMPSGLPVAGSPLSRLRALGAQQRQLVQEVKQAVAEARRQGRSWGQIANALGAHVSTAYRRYCNATAGDEVRQAQSS